MTTPQLPLAVPLPSLMHWAHYCPQQPSWMFDERFILQPFVFDGQIVAEWQVLEAIWEEDDFVRFYLFPARFATALSFAIATIKAWGQSQIAMHGFQDHTWFLTQATCAACTVYQFRQNLTSAGLYTTNYSGMLK